MSEDVRVQDSGEGELPEPPRQEGDRLLWVGAFVIVALLALIGVLFTMTSPAMFRGRYIVFTTVPDAGGIRRGDPVQMRGVNIGRVLRFRINKDEGSVTLRLEIEGEYQIPADSHIELRTLSLLSGQVAAVIPGKSDQMVASGGSLPGTSEQNMMETVNRIATQSEQVLNRVQTLVSPDTIDNVHQSSAELRDLLKKLSGLADEQRAELKGLTESLRKSASNMEGATANARDLSGQPELKTAIQRLDTLTAQLSSTSQSLDKAAKSMESTMGQVERGEGSLGRLTRDPELYNNLNQAVKDMSELTQDIKRNPKKYINVKVF